MSKTSRQRRRWREQGTRPVNHTDAHSAGAYSKVSTAPSWLVKRCRSRHADARLRAARYGTRVDPMLMPHVMAKLLYETTRCATCPAHLTHEIEQHNTATLDHIVPLWQGGPHALENLQVLCRKCHRVKSNSEVPPALASVN